MHTRDVVEEGLKPSADMSAEERFYNRSRKIRRKILKWLYEHVGEAWRTESSMDRDAANVSGCSLTTAHRWIFQLTGPGQPFEIQETTELYILRERVELE